MGKDLLWMLTSVVLDAVPCRLTDVNHTFCMLRVRVTSVLKG